MNARPECHPLYEAIQTYCNRGWAVFPLAPGHKTPMTARGFKDATHQFSDAVRLFKRKDANLGIATGASGLVVVDIDGPEAKEHLINVSPDKALPHTYTVKTRKASGLHLYFTAPDDISLKCSASQLFRDIDVRAAGGYVVAPPSWVQADQRAPAGSYEVLIDVTPQRLPDWLLGRLIAAENIRSEPKATRGATEPVQSETPRTVAILRSQLAHISADCDGVLYRRIIWSILSTHWRCAEEIALEWSLSAPHRFEQAYYDSLVRDFDPHRPDCPSLGSIWHAARQGGWHD